MNRRSFFGLFGGAAVVPFVKVPVVEAASFKPTEWRHNLGVGVWVSSDGRYVTDEMVENTRGQRDMAGLFINAPYFEWPQVYP